MYTNRVCKSLTSKHSRCWRKCQCEYDDLDILLLKVWIKLKSILPFRLKDSCIHFRSGNLLGAFKPRHKLCSSRQWRLYYNLTVKGRKREYSLTVFQLLFMAPKVYKYIRTACYKQGDHVNETSGHGVPCCWLNYEKNCQHAYLEDLLLWAMIDSWLAEWIAISCAQYTLYQLFTLHPLKNILLFCSET